MRYRPTGRPRRSRPLRRRDRPPDALASPLSGSHLLRRRPRRSPAPPAPPRPGRATRLHRLGVRERPASPARGRTGGAAWPAGTGVADPGSLRRGFPVTHPGVAGASPGDAASPSSAAVPGAGDSTSPGSARASDVPVGCPGRPRAIAAPGARVPAGRLRRRRGFDGPGVQLPVAHHPTPRPRPRHSRRPLSDARRRRVAGDALSPDEVRRSVSRRTMAVARWRTAAGRGRLATAQALRAGSA